MSTGIFWDGANNSHTVSYTFQLLTIFFGSLVPHADFDSTNIDLHWIGTECVACNTEITSYIVFYGPVSLCDDRSEVIGCLGRLEVYNYIYLYKIYSSHIHV